MFQILAMKANKTFLFQAKAYPMSSQLDTNSGQEETETDGDVALQPSKKQKKRSGFESETSADEADTDNEMTFIRNPSGRENKTYSSGFNAESLSFLRALDVENSDSENEDGVKDRMSTAVGHLFTE